MKFLSAIVLMFACLCLTIGCAQQQAFSEDSFADLTSSELANYEVVATKGDVHACTRLANYYLYIKGDKKKAIQWLRTAAKTGYPLAEHNLGVLLSSSDNPEEIKESQWWLKKASASGLAY